MRGVIRRIIQWALNNECRQEAPALASISTRSEATPSCRVGIINAMNGRILEVSTFKHNPHGPDWTSELFIVPEDQTVTEALTTVLVLKGVGK